MRSSADRKSLRAQYGFTLIETLVAIAIAAVGLLTIFELFPAGFQASQKSQARVTATTIASDILSAYRREMTNGSGATFSAMAKFTQTYTEGLATKYTNDYTVFGAGTVTGDPAYFYKVWINEVIDPTEKYSSAIAMTEQTPNRPLDGNYALPDVVGLRRVTVFVRGPLPSASQANLASPKVKSWVEIKMVTYVANYKMAFTTTQFQAGPGAVDSGGSAIPPNRIYLSVAGGGAAGFTIFNPNNLSIYEKDDTGPPSTIKYSTLYSGGTANTTAPPLVVSTGHQFWWGLNELRLDNLWIGSLNDFNFNYASDPTGAGRNEQGESNKVVNIQLDSSGGVRNGFYFLETLHALRGRLSGGTYVPYNVGEKVYGIVGVQTTN